MSDLERMAREAGVHHLITGGWESWSTELERLAAAIRADEREKCAARCLRKRLEDPCAGEEEAHNLAVDLCVAAIRAGSEPAGRSEG